MIRRPRASAEWTPPIPITATVGGDPAMCYLFDRYLSPVVNFADADQEFRRLEEDMKKTTTFSLTALCFFALIAHGQQAPRANQPQFPGREDALDPTPINPAVDPNIEMFINDWRNSTPRSMYGKLVFRDILTKLEGPDPQHPAKKGAVLTAITAISYATLAPGAVAGGRAEKGERQVFYATGGSGQITANSKSFDVKKGTGFTLTPDFEFKMTSTGQKPLSFYVRTEPLPANSQPGEDIVVMNRFENDRRVGAHWAHINDGGPNGMSLIAIAPHTMPQPHSHPGEECWIMVEGESMLSLGKNLRRMTAGQAYKIPPTGITAHSNMNLGDEPVEMIFMGPAGGGGGRGRGGQGGTGGQPGQASPAGQAGRGGQPATDYSRLDNSPYTRGKEQDIDMFMGNWRDAFPRIMHGNLYFKDMLTALQGPDPLHPNRKGAVLVNAEAVSYAMLEPGSSAHPVEGELNGIQQTFVVNSGTGVITSGSKSAELSKDMAFIITPGMDFRLTATGDKYMSFYVISERIPQGFTPRTTLQVVDNHAKSQVTNAWVDKERPLITKEDGLSQFGAVTQVEMDSMTMSRPYSDGPGAEEIWIATDGDSEMLLGKELRGVPAGTAYLVPATGITAHANINVSGKPAKFLYMVK
jgi:mannose-6-phosphate isomerase-like protein (cupin superfamily)